MRRSVCIALGVVLAAGCSSGHSRARSSTSSTTRRPTLSAEAVSPGRAAVLLARRMVIAAVLPPGAQRSGRRLPPELRGSFYVTPYGEDVGAHQEWTVPGDAGDVQHFFETHVPTGFTLFATGSGADTRLGLMSLGVEYRFRVQPPNVSDDTLDIEVERDPGSTTAVVSVAARVSWTKLRPPEESVPARDRVAIVRVVRLEPGSPVARRVVVSDAKSFGRIVHAFVGLRVSPKFGTRECGPGSAQVLYRISFATVASARPDVVAIDAACSPIAVTVLGRRVPNLIDSGPFGTAVANVLGHSFLGYDRTFG